MKDFHLRFATESKGWPEYFLDLLDGDIDTVTAKGGAYVLGASDGTMLTYPWGSSPIFYIGKAGNLRRRLTQHRDYIKAAIVDHDAIGWWPRYQYGAAFGADCACYSRHGPENVQNVEAVLVESFYYAFGSIPAANSVWPRKIRSGIKRRM